MPQDESGLRPEGNREASIVEKLRADYEKGISEAGDACEEDMALLQILTFFLGDERYSVETIFCKEVLRVPSIVWIPRVPHQILGIINLRGKIFSVTDLCRLFDQAPLEQKSRSRLVVISNGTTSTAVLVSRIGTVLDIRENLFQEVPRAFSSKRRRFTNGQVLLDGELTLNLDVEQILTCPEMRIERKKV